MALVTIPNCTAHHLLGDEQIHLASAADLSLVKVHGSIDTPPLTLTLGESIAFPLDSETVLGTQSGNGRVYLLRPHLTQVEGPQGWIKIELPEGVDEVESELGKLRDQWEEILVKYGYLYGAGIRAGGDEIASGLKEGGFVIGDKISEAEDNYKTSHSPTDAPMSFSRNTHSRAERANSITGTAADYARQAAGIITGLSHTAGASIARTFGVGQVPEEEKSQTRKAVEATGRAAGDVAVGISDGASTVTSSAMTAASNIIEHAKGEEAATIAGHAGSTVSHVGEVAGAGLIATSAAAHGTSAARGVVEVDLNPDMQVTVIEDLGEKDRKEEKSSTQGASLSEPTETK